MKPKKGEKNGGKRCSHVDNSGLDRAGRIPLQRMKGMSGGWDVGPGRAENVFSRLDMAYSILKFAGKKMAPIIVRSPASLHTFIEKKKLSVSCLVID